MKTILVLSANPKDTVRLRLDNELREIDEGLRRSQNREQFSLQAKWAVRLRDLRRALLDTDPDIVHFCGHSGQKGLMVEDNLGNAVLVNADALAALFGTLAGKVECLLLNACYSEEQAKIISTYVPYVIGMPSMIEDALAIEFAVGFYDALGAGKSIEESYKIGRNALQFYNIEETSYPVLEKGPHSHLNENDKPDMLAIKSRFVNAVPRYDPKLLVNRVDITAALHATLKTARGIFLLNGVGGIGKSTFALAYCNNLQYMQDFDHIAWISTTGDLKFDMITGLSNETIGFIFRSDLSINDNLNALVAALSRIDGHNLLVIDNANNPDAILDSKAWLEKTDWKVLITTRAQIPYMQSLSIEALEMSCCKELFYRYYKKERNDAALEALCRAIYFHTLLIELIAKVGNLNPTLNIGHILDLVNVDFIKAPHLQIDIPLAPSPISQEKYGHEVRLYSFIDHIFEVSFLSDEEKCYLRYFTLLPALDIDIYVIFALFDIPPDLEIDCISILNGLVRKGWLIQENNFYKIHELIQKVLYYKLVPDSSNCSTLVNSLNKLLFWSYGSTENYIEKVKYLIFAESVWKSIQDKSLAVADLGENIGNRYKDLGRFFEILPVAEQVLKIKEISLGSKHHGLASIHNLMGLAYWRLNDYEHATANYHRAIDLVKLNQPAETHLYFDLCNYLNNLGIVEGIYGNYEQAKNQYEEAIGIITSHLEDNLKRNELQLAVYYGNLSFIYRDMKDYLLAKKAQEISLQLREKYFDQKHPLLARCYNNTCAVYLDVNEVDKARAYLDKAISIYSLYYEELNINWFEILTNEVKLRLKLGQLSEARINLEKAKRCFDQNYNNSPHYYLLEYYYLLAILSLQLAHFREAQQSVAKAIEMSGLLFGDQYPKRRDYDNLMTQIQEAENEKR